MPRPKSPDPRTEIIALRLTLAEVVDLRRLADANGTTSSGYIRALITTAIKQRQAKRRGRPPITPPRQRTITIVEPHRLDAESYHHIQRLGVNLNQIAKHCNTWGTPPPAELAPLLAEIRAVLTAAVAPRPTGAARRRPPPRKARAA